MKKYIWFVVIFVLFVLTATNVLLMSPLPGKLLISSVKSAGYDLKINGRLTVSVFPALSARATNAVLTNPADAVGAPPLLSARSIEVSTGFWSLIGNPRTINSVHLDEPRINATVDVNGRPNWTPRAKTTTRAGVLAAGAGASAWAIHIQSVSITRGTIAFRDTKNHISLQLDAVGGKASRIDTAAGRVASIDVKGDRFTMRDSSRTAATSAVLDDARITASDITAERIARAGIAGARATISGFDGQSAVTLQQADANAADIMLMDHRLGQVDLKSGTASYRDANGADTMKLAGLDATVKNLSAKSSDTASIGTLAAGAKTIELQAGEAKTRLTASGATARAADLNAGGASAIALTGVEVLVRDATGKVMAAARNAQLDAAGASLRSNTLQRPQFKASTLSLAEITRSTRPPLADIAVTAPKIAFGEPIEAQVSFSLKAERVEGRARLPAPEALMLASKLPASIAFKARHGSLDFDGEIAGGGATRGDIPALKGRFTSSTPSLQAMAKWLELPLPDGFAGAASATGDLETKGNRLALSNGRIEHNGQAATGSIAVETTPNGRQRISGRLAADTIDADRYLPAVASARAPITRSTRGGTTAGIADDALTTNEILKIYLRAVLNQPPTRGKRINTDVTVTIPAPARSVTRSTARPSRPIEWDDNPIRIAGLDRIDLDLDLTIKTLHMRSFEISVPSLKTVLDNGKLELAGTNLATRQGRLSGTAVIDTRQAVPQVSANLKGEGIDVLKLMNAFNIPPMLSGSGIVEANLTSRGASQKQLVDAVSGRLQARMNGGRIIGYDVSTLGGLIAARRYDPNRSMPFQAMTADLKLDKGVANDTIVELKGSAIGAEAKGSIKLIPQEIDYTARIRLNWISNLLVSVFGDWAKPDWKYSLGGLFSGGSNGNGTAPDLNLAEVFGDAELSRLADRVLTTAGPNDLNPAATRVLQQIKDAASAPGPAPGPAPGRAPGPAGR